MMKKLTLAAAPIVIIASLIIGQRYTILKSNSPLPTIGARDERPIVTINGIDIKVYVAKTPKERAQGLSGRRSLGKNEGMLFIFDKDTYNSFWMKDMNFAIDIIWINDGKIVHISKNTPTPPPNTPDSQLKFYSSPDAYDTVLEVNAGFSDKYGVEVGDEVDLSNIN